jgi:hypothetical protein
MSGSAYPVALYNEVEIDDSLDFVKLQVAYNVFKVKLIEQLRLNGPFGESTPALRIYSLDKQLDFLFQESAKNRLKRLSIDEKNEQASFWLQQVFKVHIDARKMHQEFVEINKYQARNFVELWAEYLSLMKMAFRTFPHSIWVGPVIPSFFDNPFA